MGGRREAFMMARAEVGGGEAKKMKKKKKVHNIGR